MIDGDNCRNCGCGEFVADYQRGNVVCVECGCEDAYGQLQVADATYDDCVDAFGCRIFAAPPRESVVSGAYFTTPALERAVAASTRKNSPPYKRETYWSERISQVTCFLMQREIALGLEPAGASSFFVAKPFAPHVFGMRAPHNVTYNAAVLLVANVTRDVPFFGWVQPGSN